ncbi:MAG TPA: hypothetical protein VKU90_15745 [Caulobacteraceae bacterium]|nr:hypothetical protein [Caulobacteraceae bacterium]
MNRSANLSVLILALGALLGVTLGLLLPAPNLRAGHSGHLITPGEAAR